MTRRFTVVECDQRSPEWLAARIGRVTSTGAVDMLKKGRGSEEAVGKRDLRLRLALERMGQRPLEDDYTSRAMQQGIEREAAAYAAYEALTGRMLERTGFCSHNDLMAGCSLDGSFDNFTGLVEIKAPEWQAHYEALKTNTVPTNYLRQVNHALFITGAEWCDWMSYNPDFTERLQVKLIRVERNPKALEAYEDALTLFLAEVDLKVQELQTLDDPIRQLERSIA